MDVQVGDTILTKKKSPLRRKHISGAARRDGFSHPLYGLWA